MLERKPGHHYRFRAQAGCYVCAPDAMPTCFVNAHLRAARHARRFGHHTWVDQRINLEYNRPEVENGQAVEETMALPEPDMPHSSGAPSA